MAIQFIDVGRLGLLSIILIGSANIHEPVLAGAKGPVGAYSAPSPQGRVVVGTMPGQRGKRRGAPRPNRIVIRTHRAGNNGIGPRNYYFERGTGISGTPSPAMPSVYFHSRTQRDTNPVHRTRPMGTDHRMATRSLSVRQVRELTDRLPPRRRNNVIDPRSPAAARESSGIRFGPSGKDLVQALASKSAPASERDLRGYRQGAPSHDANNLPAFDTGRHRGNQYLFVQGVWYLPKAGRLRPVIPPVGLTMPRLPVGYVAVATKGQQYFTADGVYLRPFSGGYVVVSTP